MNRLLWTSLAACALVLFSCKFPDDKKFEKPQSSSIEFNYHVPPELEIKVSAIDILVKKKIKAGTFNGVVLVTQNNDILYQKSNGFANFKTKEKLDEHSVFQLASVSKMFTATAVMLLKEQGKLDYDDAVKKYLPLFPFDGVTIRHLLMHRSGLPRYMVTSDLFWPRDTMMSNEDMYFLMANHCPPKYFSPDQKFNYQNSNYAYLAYLVEVISEQPFDRFVRNQIFEPLEMFDSHVYSADSTRDIPGMVKGHIYRRPRVLNANENYINGVVGDKGVYTTVFDLFKFDQALYTDKLLSQETIHEAYVPGKRNRFTRRDDYGFGWRISTFKKDRLVYHYGWWNGFKTCFMRFLDKRRSIIILTNRDRRLNLPKQIQEILYMDDVDQISAVEFFSKRAKQ